MTLLRFLIFLLNSPMKELRSIWIPRRDHRSGSSRKRLYSPKVRSAAVSIVGLRCLDPESRRVRGLKARVDDSPKVILNLA